MLAGVDRLDKDMMVAQMQVRYRMINKTPTIWSIRNPFYFLTQHLNKFQSSEEKNNVSDKDEIYTHLGICWESKVGQSDYRPKSLTL